MMRVKGMFTCMMRVKGMFTMNDEGFTNYTDLNQFEQETSY